MLPGTSISTLQSFINNQMEGKLSTGIGNLAPKSDAGGEVNGFVVSTNVPEAELEFAREISLHVLNCPGFKLDDKSNYLISKDVKWISATDSDESGKILVKKSTDGSNSKMHLSDASILIDAVAKYKIKETLSLLKRHSDFILIPQEHSKLSANVISAQEGPRSQS